VQLFRAQEPERFEGIRAHLVSFKHRMELVQATGPEDLAVMYRPGNVVPFVVKNLLALVLGLPLVALGLVLFWLPYQLPRAASRKAELDVQATVKFLTAFVVALVWWGALTVAAGWMGGLPWGVAAFLAVPPLALFTLYFAERWEALRRDITVFFTLGNRARLKTLLLADGERLASEVERLADEYRPKLGGTPMAGAAPVTP
jgi:hypothetical protein